MGLNRDSGEKKELLYYHGIYVHMYILELYRDNGKDNGNYYLGFRVQGFPNLGGMRVLSPHGFVVFAASERLGLHNQFNTKQTSLAKQVYEYMGVSHSRAPFGKKGKLLTAN